ncbi:MAG: phosphate/phosphite/phosphonate ABC transporter substrate-binding protein [Azonexus sp.]|jgi:phosphonate transport system substrate-binding protein|uniref:phosphate/phosphite/phosphonate ABC transporter substrate-binding protein n=1 Tax=Azonexus sp. TaxID=1872668 RepID=UPI0028195C57|nr:phosphate/phosphite/phosphonate ABC transporter substrate-binding protein [Azonexus sp.]MDR0776868.1 phosphate/phosphite/phosphonate ABC transporter substrate-binding protein [Azonexus sp.]
MRRRILGTGLALLGLHAAASGSAIEQKHALRLAVLPHTSPLTLIQLYRPLKSYLRKSLGRPVELYSAPSFSSFVTALMVGDYDIVMSPPHLAVMAMERNYAPLLRYRACLEPVLTMADDSSFTDVRDLRDMRIAVPDHNSLIRLAGLKWLADNGLESGRDYRLTERSSHAAVAGAVVAGEVDAGLTSTTVMRYLPVEMQRELRTIRSGLCLPHVFTIAHRRLGKPLLGRIKAVLQAFPDTEAGRLFMARTGFEGYQEIDDESLRALAPWVALYRELQKQGQV